MPTADYAKLSNEQLVDEYEAGPTALLNATGGVTPDQMRQPITPGNWSILGVLCHIADFEVINAERIRRVLSEHQPTLFNGDPDEFERALIYQNRDAHQELAVIGVIRSQTGRILRHLPEDAWRRCGIHSTDGPLSLRQLIERVTDHIPHHIAFINGKLEALARCK